MSPQSPWEDPAFARMSLANNDPRFLPGTRQEVDFLERALGLAPGASVLDLGCGAGRHAIEFARRGYRVTGVDISRALLEEAASRAGAEGATVDWRELDLRELASSPLAVGCFDAAVCLCEAGFGVLGGVRADVSFLRAVADLLPSGGGFALTCFNAIRRYRRLGAAFDYLAGTVHWQTPPEAGDLQEDVRIYTPSEIRLLLDLAGFTDLDVCGCAPGNFAGQRLEPDDIEMMVLARRNRNA